MANRSLFTILSLFILLHTITAIPQWPSWEDSTPSPAVDDGSTHLYNLTRHFFGQMMVPNNLVELEGLNSKIFAENITGRVSDSRKFLGRELNTEYVYGAFSGAVVNDTRITLIGMPRRHQTMRFASNVPDKSAFITELVDFEIPLLGKTIPVQIDLWFRWNDADEVSAYDARFVYFDWLMADGMRIMATRYKLASAEDAATQTKKLLVGQICETAMANCQGDLQQYESMEQCQEFLMNEKRLGQPFEFGVDTVLCRSLHEGMLTLKPSVHCAHVGPSGGDMCVDNLSYGDYVADVDFFGEPRAGW